MIDREVNLPKQNSFFLFGARQTGKSTLLKIGYEPSSTLYYDLLKTDEYLRLSARPSLIREEIMTRNEKITHVIIDEIQRIPSLLNEVHWIMESGKSPVFILTGSSARKLKRSHANLLAGRALTYKLYPLTFREVGGTFSLQKTLRYGSLPSIVCEDEEEMKMEKLRAYADTYLKEEIEIEAQVRNLQRFVRFLTTAAHTNGELINYSNIARETGTSYQTVKSYFQILEDTLIGNFLYPYTKSKRKRLSRQPKFYFFDVGVVRALTRRLTVAIEPQTSDYGKAFEHFIILEIMRANEYERWDLEFSFYRTEAGAEVDLIIETPKGEVLAIEIKGTDNIARSHLRGLKSFLSIRESAHLACVSNSKHQRKIDGIDVLPWKDVINWIKERL
jgi:uncharacterized protein